jgi:hypothetical protein
VAVVVAIGGLEADQHLVEDDVVEDLDAIVGGQPVGEAAGQRAATLDQLGDAAAARCAWGWAQKTRPES